MQLFAVYTKLAVYVLFRAMADLGMRGKPELSVTQTRNVLATWVDYVSGM